MDICASSQPMNRRNNEKNERIQIKRIVFNGEWQSLNQLHVYRAVNHAAY